MVVKATFAKPGEMTKQGRVVSNGKYKWLFLHSNNLKDLLGPGFMLTEEMFPFLYHKWRQPNTIAKLRAERAAKQTPAIPTQVEDEEENTACNKHAADSIASHKGENDSIATDIISNDESVHMEVDSAAEYSTKKEDDPETEAASQTEETSADTVQKEVTVAPSKSTYLDAVLQGKFNSFHVLGDHREAIMMKE